VTDDKEFPGINADSVHWYPVEGSIVVWLSEYRTYGFLLREGVHVSTVAFTNPEDGERVIESIENDEWTYWSEYAIDYED
jgi:hypothetical protein